MSGWIVSILSIQYRSTCDSFQQRPVFIFDRYTVRIIYLPDDYHTDAALLMIYYAVYICSESQRGASVGGNWWIAKDNARHMSRIYPALYKYEGSRYVFPIPSSWLGHLCFAAPRGSWGPPSHICQPIWRELGIIWRFVLVLRFLVAPDSFSLAKERGNNMPSVYFFSFVFWRHTPTQPNSGHNQRTLRNSSFFSRSYGFKVLVTQRELCLTACIYIPETAGKFGTRKKNSPSQTIIKNH